jgi:hypothetical protein
MSRSSDAALWYARHLGWAVFPVDGKTPATRNGLHDASRDLERVSEMFAWAGESAGVAVACGAVSGIWAVDIDSTEAARALRAAGELPDTLTSRTARGWHLIWQICARTQSCRVGVMPGIDVRGDGGYVVLPPSPHPDGKAYEWVDGKRPDQIRAAPAPAWLELKCSASQRPQRDWRSELTAPILEGRRNAELASRAGWLIHAGIDARGAYQIVHAINTTCCSPPLTAEETDQIVISVLRYKKRS